MNDFRTTIKIEERHLSLGLKTSVLTLGSCFADVIGLRLKKSKIFSIANPFGVIYNPHSIHKVLKYAIRNAPVLSNTFVQNQDIHFNYDFHSELSSPQLVTLQHALKEKIQTTHDFINSADWLIITYGTAWVHERNDTGEVVSNCHKLPANVFSKTLLTHKKIIESFEDVYRELKLLNPEIKIMLTVSPVRHIKDTLQLNSVSKSVLRLACHTLSTSFKDVAYFPAYEIMMDDLRDYRFYKADMIHPSEEAENYIWQKFIDTYANNEFIKFLIEWNSILDALAHKPFHPETKSHQTFLKKTIQRLQALNGIVDVQAEVQMLKDQLLSL